MSMEEAFYWLGGLPRTSARFADWLVHLSFSQYTITHVHWYAFVYKLYWRFIN